MLKKIFAGVVFILVSVCAEAQVDFNRQFLNAKELFRDGKYNLAMEMLKPLIPYDKSNPYAEYASFYYALAAYNQGYKSVARDQFNHIKTIYPTWDKMDEVNLWLGKIHFDNGDYFQGLKVLSAINDRKMQKDIDAVKGASLKKVTDVETLRMMYEEYPQDVAVAKGLARELSKDLNDASNRSLLENIIQSHNLRKSDFIPEAPKSFEKSKYSVSLIMPFMVNTLEPTPGRKRNQIVLDFYEGAKLAADTLNTSGAEISLRAYDSEREVSKIRNVLSTEELLNTDLIIGPFFQEESKPILDFALKNKVNVFNPFANNSDLLENNPYSFLFQPSTETMGKASGEFLSRYAQKKNCLVIQGTTRRDSLLAETFMKTAREQGLKIVGSKIISREGVRNILPMLATPTEYDEFRYPKEFTLKKDSLGSIFVASDDPLIFAKVISAIETRGDKIIVLGSETWLDQSVVDFEKYQTLPIVLAAPNFVDQKDPDLLAFTKKFIRVHGRVPSAHARLGYELMMFSGTQLRENGVYFQEALYRRNYVPGFLYQGFNYQSGRNNLYVPFIRYEDQAMKVIEKR